MKKRLKNWITTIMGLLFMVLAGYMIWLEKDTLEVIIAFTFGIALVFSKDTLIKKLISKL